MAFVPKRDDGPRDSRVIAVVRSDWLALVCARHRRENVPRINTENVPGELASSIAG